MFLKMKRAIRRDDGVALAAVVGLMLVGVLLTVVILASVVSAISYSTATRAGVQSQAAAEAGIAAARAGLAAGTCSEVSGAPVYVSASGAIPSYSATIWRPASGGGWEARCPVGLTTTARIVSTGYAVADGAAGVSAGDETRLEAVLSSGVSPTVINASGPAIFAYSSTGFGGGGTLYSIDGSSPDVMVKTGNVVCNGGSNGISDLVVENGTLEIQGTCGLAGNAWSSGRTTIQGSAVVGGNVVAAGISNGGRINGSVWSSLDVTVTGGADIYGTATGQTLALNSGRIRGDAWIFGAADIRSGGFAEKNLTARTLTRASGPLSNYVGGTLTLVPAGPGPSSYSTAPVRPIVPVWYNFVYDSTKWTGFTEAVMTGSCTRSQIQAVVTSFGAAAGVIDARGCTNGIDLGGNDSIAMLGDIAFIANRFSFKSNAGFTSLAEHRLWLITPDGNASDPAPNCPTGASFEMSGNFDFTSNIGVMIYSPCAIVLSSGIDTFRGQVFVGAAGISGGATLGYRAIGLPGVDLDSGLATTSTSTTTARTLLSLRNVTG